MKEKKERKNKRKEREREREREKERERMKEKKGRKKTNVFGNPKALMPSNLFSISPISALIFTNLLKNFLRSFLRHMVSSLDFIPSFK